MNKFKNVKFSPLVNSIYIKPLKMHFTLNGIERSWDLLQIHDSVAIIIFNITRKVLVFVKQFRPAVYYNSIPHNSRNAEIDTTKYPMDMGVTLECCAGLVDKDLPLVEIARDEVLEECGYKIDSSYLEMVSTFRAGVGVTGSKQTMYYCEVTDDMKVASGGGVEDESIEVVEMSIPQIKEYISQENVLSPASFMFGIYWFLKNKVKECFSEPNVS